MRKLINKLIEPSTVLILSATAFTILMAFVITDKFTPLGDEPLVQRPEVVRVDMEFPAERFGRRDFKIEIGTGSGIIVGEDRILTNWHVVRGYLGAREIRVTLKDGSVRVAKVIKVDRVHDLALLRIPPVLYAPAKPGEPVDKGDRVTICGFPHAGEYAEVRGTVVGWGSPLPTLPDTVFKVNQRGAPGMSGGPVFNDSGELVGILFGSLDYANCMTIEKIQEFLR